MESAVAVLRRRAGTIAEAIVQRSPEGSITVVFAGGSLARGAVWAATVAGTIEIYSDIDLYVVVAQPRHLAAVRAAAGAAVRAAGHAVEGARFLRGTDAGVYTAADLRAQPLRPGTADLRTRHLVLYGDAQRVPAMLPAPGCIGAEEALYLLENRAWDAWDVAPARPASPADPARLRLARVMSMKLDLDLAAAYLIVAGADPAVVTDPVPALRAGSVADVPGAVREAALRAARARDDLGVFLGGESGDDPPLARVCRAWLEIAPRVFGPADAGGLIARRCREGRRLANAREFVRTARRAGIGRPRALHGALRCCARSARATLRVHAIADEIARDQAGRALAAHARHAQRVTAALGFSSGTLGERVRAARRAVS